MAQSSRAGQPAQPSDLVDVPHLVTAYFALEPDPDDPAQQVSFGTSGHRGSAFDVAFNEAHIVATTLAIVEHRRAAGVDGPLFLGVDSHALSEPARASALEVLVAHDVDVRVAPDRGLTPTPAVSHAILTHNRRLQEEGRTSGLADGIVVTPSHNPPRDGGFKYNPPHGGPAGSDVTGAVQDRANEILRSGWRSVPRVPLTQAERSDRVTTHDYRAAYVEDLAAVLDLEAVASAGVRLGVDPLGGASVGYWEAVAERYGLDLTVTEPGTDPTFRTMTLDSDGQIRMDCSSPDAMARLTALADRFDLALGADADADRHGVVVPGHGLLNPNHYLAVAIAYLAEHRDGWGAEAGIGKTMVSSSIIDRVVDGLGRRLVEVPVGFKWFVDGLGDGSLLFGGEESAGASFLRRDGGTWTTDKDGMLLGLLAAEVTAVTGEDPAARYRALTSSYGEPVYRRVDAPATAAQKAVLKALGPEDLGVEEVAGSRVTRVLTEAPGNGAAFGGVKVETDDGWFAARPSGTEDKYKIYAESFRGDDHLDAVLGEAQRLVDEALADA